MSVNGSNNFLNIEDANLRVRNGSVHAQGMTIGGAIVSASHGLQSVSDTGNTTSNTLQFTNATTAFKATSNIELTANTAIVVESNVLMDFKTLGQIEFPGSTVEQEYPPRALTGYETLVEGHGVFTVYSTGGLYDNGTGGNLPWTVFNKITGTFNDGSSWVSEDAAGAAAGGNYNNGGSSGYGGSNRLASNTPLGDYLVICLPYPIALNSYSLSNLSGASGFGAADFPRDYIIYGSSDSVNWEVVDSRSDQEAGGLAPAAHVSAGYLGYTNNYTVSGNNIYSKFAIVITDINSKPWYDHNTTNASYAGISEWKLFGTPGPTILDKGSLSLTRSLDVPRVSRYDVDTETPRPEKLVVDFDTTVNSSPTDISGKGNHGAFNGGATYSAADKAFDIPDAGNISATLTSIPSADFVHSVSVWVKFEGDTLTTSYPYVYFMGTNLSYSGFGLFFAGAARPNQLHVSCWQLDYPINFTFSNDTWHHVTYTYSGGGWSRNSSLKAYVDGIEYGFGTNWSTGTEGTTPTIATSNVPLRLGAVSTGGVFDGKISNFKLYSVVLEPSEVQKLYRLGRTGRSMVISDTAVGIGKVPEAQLDVRGNLRVGGTIQVPLIISMRWINGGDVTVTSGNYIPFNGVIYENPTGLHNGSYITCPIKGVYECVANILTDNGGNYDGNHTWLVNGSETTPHSRGFSVSTGIGNVHKQATSHFYLELNSGDTVGLGGVSTIVWYGHNDHGHSQMSIRLITPT